MDMSCIHTVYEYKVASTMDMSCVHDMSKVDVLESEAIILLHSNGGPYDMFMFASQVVMGWCMCGTWALGWWCESTEVTGEVCVTCVAVVMVDCW